MESRVVLSTFGPVEAAESGDYGQGEVNQSSYGNSGSSYDVTVETLGQYAQDAVDYGMIHEYGEPFPEPGLAGEEWYVEYYGTDSGPYSSPSADGGWMPAAEDPAGGGVAMLAAEDPAVVRAREIKEYNDDVAKYNSDRIAYNGRHQQYTADSATYYTKVADFNRRYGTNLNPKVALSYDATTGRTKGELTVEINTQAFNSMSSAAKAEKRALDTIAQDLLARFNLIQSEHRQLQWRRQGFAGRYQDLMNRYHHVRKVQP